MKILILSWRDPLNPLAGGAEKVTWEYAKYWVSQGHKVCWLASKFTLSRHKEVVDGITIDRIGPQLGQTVANLLITYPLFLLSIIAKVLSLRFSSKIDITIDQIHGLPFFIPFYGQGRKVLWVCEVADEIWKKMFPFPINFIGRILEKTVYMFYQGCEVWAISKSTRRDILALNPGLDVKVIPLGIYKPKVDPKIKKNPYPSAVFLARIVRMKGAESAIAACQQIVKKYPKFKLVMIGSGPPEYRDYLQQVCKKKGVADAVTFVGRVSEDEKYRYLQQAHFMFHPSYKEGFGLSVLEAGSCGTPTIARGGSSLEELITDKKDGLIFTSDSTIADLFLDYFGTSNYESMINAARKTADRYSWSKVFKQSARITGI